MKKESETETKQGNTQEITRKRSHTRQITRKRSRARDCMQSYQLRNTANKAPNSHYTRLYYVSNTGMPTHAIKRLKCKIEAFTEKLRRSVQKKLVCWMRTII